MTSEERTQQTLTQLEILRNTGRNFLTVSYHRSLLKDGTPFGREHASGFSSQGMNRKIRAALFSGLKIDVDMVNFKKNT